MNKPVGRVIWSFLLRHAVYIIPFPIFIYCTLMFLSVTTSNPLSSSCCILGSLSMRYDVWRVNFWYKLQPSCGTWVVYKEINTNHISSTDIGPTTFPLGKHVDLSFERPVVEWLDLLLHGVSCLSRERTGDPRSQKSFTLPCLCLAKGT